MAKFRGILKKEEEETTRGGALDVEKPYSGPDWRSCA